jgi:histone-lysine N-methyltransferase EZH2
MLFCRRCHRYDCFLHKDKSIIPDFNNNQSKTNSNIIYRPCNSHCYRNKPILQNRRKIDLKRSHSELFKTPIKNGFYSKRLKSEEFSSSNIYQNGFILKSSLKRKLNDELSNWLSSEKSLFRVFSTIFNDNLCMIANLLDKPCSQVYTFYLNEKNIFLKKQFSFNSIDMKINEDDLIDDDIKISNTTRRSHSSSFRRQRSHQQILLNHHNHCLLEKKRHTYYPCDHDRSQLCNENCCCIRSGNFCEKYCCCSSTKCDNRFPGCRCRSSCTTKQCPCYAAARECDPDLCTSCGADDFHNNELITKSSCSCHNVAIQRSLHKSLLLAESDVAGWGMFTQVNIQRNEFIAEYCGEILTQDEGELRGRMYDTIGTSFLFDLNEEYMVDATRRGNKIRFANHSINPNCYAKVIMVNGDHRIGIYSKRFISAGEELFFDYRYGANHHLKFVGVEKNIHGDQADTLLL